MSRVIVKQPNEKYSVWSTVVDNFILVNASKKDLENFFVMEAIKKAKEQLKDDLKRLELQHQLPYYLNIVKEYYGEAEYKTIINAMELESKGDNYNE